jgi:hypothetical protein
VLDSSPLRSSTPLLTAERIYRYPVSAIGIEQRSMNAPSLQMHHRLSLMSGLFFLGLFPAS